MSLHPHAQYPIPDETYRVARGFSWGLQGLGYAADQWPVKRSSNHAPGVLIVNNKMLVRTVAIGAAHKYTAARTANAPLPLSLALRSRVTLFPHLSSA